MSHARSSHHPHPGPRGLRTLIAGTILAGLSLHPIHGKDFVKDAGQVVRGGKFVGNTLSNNLYHTDAALRFSAPITETGAGRYRIGSVHLDATGRVITLPARLNMRDGVVEYALVTEGGKRHESLLTTDTAPEHIQVARLLLGSSGAATGGCPPAVEVRIQWALDGAPVDHALEELLVLRKEAPDQTARRTPMPGGPWTYQGSQFDPTGFAATREGSIIAVIRDEAALVDNPREDGLDDACHEPATGRLPPPDTPVRVLLKFPPVPPPSTR